MACVGEETAGIGQHADKPADQTQLRECLQLPFHTLPLVEMPPSAAELDLACDASVLEISGHGCQHVVVGGVEIIEYHFGKLVGALQGIHIPCKGSCLRGVADGVVSGVRSEKCVHPGIRVPDSTQVQLFGPSAGGVEMAEVEHHEPSEFLLFLSGCRLPRTGFVKNDLCLALRALGCKATFQTMVGKSSSDGMEVVMSFLEGIHESAKEAALDSANRGESVAPWVE